MLDFFDELEKYEERETLVYENITEAKPKFTDNHLFNIIHFNIRSLNKNFDELLLYIEEFDPTNIDIIVLSETWEIGDVNNFIIPNFQVYYNESHYNQNDGVVVYINKNITSISNIIHLSETKLLKFTFNINNISFKITCSYRPPSINLDLYITELNNYFSTQNRSDIEIYIGDINVNILNSTDINVNKYICMMAEFGFFPYVNKPTRESENTCSLIDHIFIRINSNTLLNKTDFKTFIFKTNITDHYTLLLSINIKNNFKTVYKNPLINNFVYINDKKLNNVLAREEWTEVLQSNEPEDAYIIFIKKKFKLHKHELPN